MKNDFLQPQKWKRRIRMEAENLMQQAKNHMLHVYNRYPVVLDHGEGVYLYDTEGNKYLDFAAGIAVHALGYGNQEYNQALKTQIDKLMHTSNLYYNQPTIEAAEKLCTASEMDRAFFTNSGTEAIEGAIKAAKKYAYEKDGCTDHEIIAMNHSFHGRSLGALAVTGNAHYREPFEPLPGIVKFADYNDLESVKSQVNEKTCAIILETIQGEGGIFPAEKGFLEGIRRICDEKDILLILDEIQCGMGRTGTMFAWQGYGVKPDIMTCAKALGCGVPVGAFVMTERVAASSLKPGDHGTTYGGNPFAGAAVSKVLTIFQEKKLTEHVKEIGAYLEERLEQMKDQYECIRARRGIGLLQGLELTIPVGEISNKALAQGLLVITAGNNVLRFVPPLVIEREHVDEMIDKLTVALNG
jgi:acetylornithine/N-succinyldiaminopimelate aminotransferase